MITCQNCNRILPAARPGQRFCKTSCQSAAYARRKRAEARAEKPKVNCRVCGKAFSPLRPDHAVCSAECRSSTPPPDPPAPPTDQIVFRMITRGYLPAPGCTAPDGSPAWSVSGLAALFDLDERTFLAMMAKRPPVYIQEPGIPSSWALLMS